MENETRNALKQRLREAVLSSLDFTKDIEDSKILEILDAQITDISQKQYISLKGKLRLKRETFNSLRRFDVLQDLIDDEAVTEIMVNGPDAIFVEKNGKIERFNGQFDSLRRLEDVAQHLAALSNRRINEASPIVDTRFGDCRVNIVLPPVSLIGPVITIRKFAKDIITMERLIELGSLNEEAAAFLSELVSAGYNILVSGGTGSGKTTMLNVLSDSVPSDERIITIEDSAELKLRQRQNLVRLETRNANTDGKNEITIRDLIKTSLRMRPDRIIVGEVRGAEALDMLAAMNTGHDGSISTIHANSAEDVCSRLETMVLLGVDLPLAAIRRQIASAIDVIVHLGRLRDKTRRILEICEVQECDQNGIKLKKIYAFVEEGETEDGKVEGSLKKISDFEKLKKLERVGRSKTAAT